MSKETGRFTLFNHTLHKTETILNGVLFELPLEATVFVRSDFTVSIDPPARAWIYRDGLGVSVQVLDQFPIIVEETGPKLGQTYKFKKVEYPLSLEWVISMMDIMDQWKLSQPIVRDDIVGKAHF